MTQEHFKPTLEKKTLCDILTLEHTKLTPEHFDPGTFQADPGTKNFMRCARLFCSQVGPKLLQSAPAQKQSNQKQLLQLNKNKKG